MTQTTPAPPLPTQAINKADALLYEKFAEEIVKQGERLDELAKQLVTVTLSILGAYTAVLKLSLGSQPLLLTPWLIFTFVFWLLALSASLAAIFPRSYRVDSTHIRRNASTPATNTLSIEEFYQKSAKFKYRALFFAAACFFIGVVCALLSMAL